MERIKTAVLLTAAALVLGGCTGPDRSTGPSQETTSPRGEPDAARPDTAAPETSRPDSSRPDSGGSAPGTPDPALDSVGTLHYTPDQLSAALAAVDTELGLGGVVHTDAQIRPQLEAGAGQLDEIVITPESCAAFIDTGVVDTIGQTTFALLTVTEDITVTVTSYADQAVLLEQARANRAALEACSTFQVQAGESVFDAETEEVPAQSNARQTFAVATLATLDGETVPTVTMNGTSGSTKVEVTLTDPGRPDEAVREGRRLIDAVLAQLAGYAA